jgi:tetratricopeptide (TPR) repeat protein
MTLTPQQRLAGLSPDLVQRVQGIEEALGQRRVGDAERATIAALALAPKHPEVLRLFATIQTIQGRPDAAIQCLAQALAQRPNDALAYNALGNAFEAVKDYTRARDALRRACELGPELAACWFNYGRRMAQDGEIETAIPLLQRAVALAPEQVGARVTLANLLQADGRSEAAAQELRRIVADHPYAGYAWWGLAVLKPMPLGAADIATLRRLLNTDTPPPGERVAMQFALAMALENRGDFAEAFAALQAGHALARRAEIYDAAGFARHVDGLLAAFPNPPAGAANGQGGEAIFIVSLPRSGSTLTEQILASHSQVEGGTEIPDLPQVIMDESDRVRAAFPQWARTHTPEQWQALGEKYLARTQRWRGQRPRSTDKAPGNWQYVGAILAMLPNARIVVCRRDPLETCFACYRYMFARHPFSHTFADLAAHWRDFDRAVRHWQALYPDRVRVQVYENLVAEPEAQIRELLEFCGLPFEEACLNFHATERRVTTPSAAQVREPMRRDTARSGKYGALLDPLREALGVPRFQGE